MSEVESKDMDKQISHLKESLFEILHSFEQTKQLIKALRVRSEIQ